MSTYAVFGMTRPKAIELAKDEMTNDPIPPAEYVRRLNAAADRIMQSQRMVRISEKFDAPQYAREFQAICARTCECRDLHVKAYLQTDKLTPSGRRKYIWEYVPAENGAARAGTAGQG